MTEAEWLSCTDPEPMLDFLRGRARQGLSSWLVSWFGKGSVPQPSEKPEAIRVSGRKLRLFACACATQVGKLLLDERCQSAVGVADEFADDLADAAQLRSAHAGALCVLDRLEEVPVPVALMPTLETLRSIAWAARVAIAVTLPEDEEAAIEASRAVMKTAEVLAIWGDATEAKQMWQRAPLIRDIFGNPFRPVTAETASLPGQGSPSMKLAEAIYEEQQLDQLPILADALEESGCTNADILAHCRGDGPHVRGCWVLDLLLGKN